VRTVATVVWLRGSQLEYADEESGRGVSG
jgi:hypothetical protein